MANAICPECRNGKHVNCDGQAWDDVADELTVCRCPDCIEAAKVRSEVIRDRHDEWWAEG